MQKEKEQLNDWVAKLIENNLRLRKIIDRVNEKKEVALSSYLSLKATILEVEIIEEES